MLLVTCPFGLASLLTTELKRLGINPQDSFPNGCWIADDSREMVIRINLHSHIANKVFYCLHQGIVSTFDELFDMTQKIDRSQHIKENQNFRVSATSKKSILHAPRTIQSITHKAIVSQLTGSKEAQWETTYHIDQLDIYIYITNNTCYIMKNTSGESLHKRGWRRDQGDAPIKENLAIAILRIARWDFKQALWDPFCGSGTLVIEAARSAKNIAPGRDRGFAFQTFPDYPADLFATIRQEAKDKEYDKSWTIVGSDIDEEVLRIAKDNAVAAGVADTIKFVYHDINDPNEHPDLQGETTLIANPPYGQRLDQYETENLHERLAELLDHPQRKGAIISGYEEAGSIFPRSRRRKETRQGKEPCYIRYTN